MNASDDDQAGDRERPAQEPPPQQPPPARTRADDRERLGDGHAAPRSTRIRGFEQRVDDVDEQVDDARTPTAATSTTPWISA